MNATRPADDAFNDPAGLFHRNVYPMTTKQTSFPGWHWLAGVMCVLLLAGFFVAHADPAAPA